MHIRGNTTHKYPLQLKQHFNAQYQHHPPPFSVLYHGPVPGTSNVHKTRRADSIVISQLTAVHCPALSSWAAGELATHRQDGNW